MDSLIVRVIHRYNPGWEPPPDNGREWVKALCPFHGESRPSAAVSYVHNAFKCYACEAKGSAVTLIKQQEAVSFEEAERLAKEMASGGDLPLPPEPRKQRRPRVFGETRSVVPVDTGRRKEVPDRVRRRAFSWSRNV